MDELDIIAEKSARGSLHLFIGNLFSEVINAVTFITIARLLTPEEMGVYGLSFVLPSLFVVFSNLGLNQALTRFLARFQSEGRWDDAKRIIRIGFLFQVVLSCLLAVLMYFTAFPLAVVVMKRPELADLVRITSVLVIVQSVYSMGIAVITGLERMDLRAVMMVVFSLVKLVFAPMLVINGYGVKGVLYGHILGVGAASILSIVLIVYYLRKNVGNPSQTMEGTLQNMLRFGFPLFLSTFLGNINLSYRGFLLAWFTNNVAIGNLDLANKFLSLVGLFTLPFMTTIYPAFSKFIFFERPEEMKALYRASIRYATLIIIPVTTIIIILSGPGIAFLFGTRYTLAPSFLSLALLPYLAVGLGSLSVFGFLNSQGDTGTSFRLSVITVGLNMVLGTFLTWRWGIPGLLGALFVSSIVGNLVNQYVVNRKYGISLDLSHTTRVVLFSVVAAVATRLTLHYFIESSSLVKMTIGGLVFLFACLILAPLSSALVDSDISVLKRVLRRVKVIYPILLPFLAFEERIIRLLRSSS